MATYSQHQDFIINQNLNNNTHCTNHDTTTIHAANEDDKIQYDSTYLVHNNNNNNNNNIHTKLSSLSSSNYLSKFLLYFCIMLIIR